MNIENKDGIEFLNSLEDNSIDLILTDPPYIISKDSGMNNFIKEVEKMDKSGENKKTEEEWVEYKEKTTYENDNKKDNYMRHGQYYGTKYCVKTDYGKWDREFTLEKLEEFIGIYYDKLKKGGTMYYVL